ncbi:WcbI family polysaccharide biosynthesis putative acetyltransferase [Synechococcus sp. CBW1006]|uniref:WcbI family polysaccharide biosynthesis putative acetyltransferase n=1 Tax=Synechococcus sp. CBW1006 TaxID=1353138 RepID=UPI001E4BAF5D|nr:WcbI family polysaccharide biosynthesis putative acetyltransferase [Synechococcus sp. CBW1006]
MDAHPGASLLSQADELLRLVPQLLDQPQGPEQLRSLAVACHGRMLELGDLHRTFAIEHALAGARLLAALQGHPASEPDWVQVHEEQCCRYGALWIHEALQQSDHQSDPAQATAWGGTALGLLKRLEQLHSPPPAWIQALHQDLGRRITAPPPEPPSLALVVVGNCQAFPLMLGLQQALPTAQITFCPSVHLATAADVAELHQALPQADLLVMHRVQTGYRNNIGLDTATLQALLAPGARCVVLPNLHYEGQLPWIAYGQDPEGRLSALEAESPLGPYHDFLAMAAAGRGLDAAALHGIPCPEAVASVLREAHHHSLAELRSREADCSVGLSDWIAERHRQQPIGHTINHPTQASLDTLLRRLLAQLHPTHQLGPDLFDRQEHLGSLSLPIHPWVQQALNLGAWASTWGQRRHTPFLIATQLDESIAFYRRHPWIEAVNATHPKLAFAQRCLDLLPG